MLSCVWCVFQSNTKNVAGLLCYRCYRTAWATLQGILQQILQKTCRKMILLCQADKMQVNGGKELYAASFLNGRWIQMTNVPCALQHTCPSYAVNWQAHKLDKNILWILPGETYSKGKASARWAFMKLVFLKHLVLYSPCVLVGSSSNRHKCCYNLLSSICCFSVVN